MRIDAQVVAEDQAGKLKPTYNDPTVQAKLRAMAAANAATGPTNATAAAAVQAKVVAALGAVSAAVLRAAVAGDPPTSVTAGAAGAFSAASNASYCGDALSLTVARLPANRHTGAPAVRLAPLTGAIQHCAE